MGQCWLIAPQRSSWSHKSMGWFKGKSTGNHRFSHEIWGFSCKFYHHPILWTNQSGWRREAKAFLGRRRCRGRCRMALKEHLFWRPRAKERKIWRYHEPTSYMIFMYIYYILYIMCIYYIYIYHISYIIYHTRRYHGILFDQAIIVYPHIHHIWYTLVNIQKTN